MVWVKTQKDQKRGMFTESSRTPKKLKHFAGSCETSDCFQVNQTIFLVMLYGKL